MALICFASQKSPPCPIKLPPLNNHIHIYSTRNREFLLGYWTQRSDWSLVPKCRVIEQYLNAYWLKFCDIEILVSYWLLASAKCWLIRWIPPHGVRNPLNRSECNIDMFKLISQATLAQKRENERHSTDFNFDYLKLIDFIFFAFLFKTWFTVFNIFYPHSTIYKLTKNYILDKNNTDILGSLWILRGNILLSSWCIN